MKNCHSFDHDHHFDIRLFVCFFFDHALLFIRLHFFELKFILRCCTRRCRRLVQQTQLILFRYFTFAHTRKADCMIFELSFSRYFISTLVFHRFGIFLSSLRLCRSSVSVYTHLCEWMCLYIYTLFAINIWAWLQENISVDAISTNRHFYNSLRITCCVCFAFSSSFVPNTLDGCIECVRYSCWFFFFAIRFFFIILLCVGRRLPYQTLPRAHWLQTITQTK